MTHFPTPQHPIREVLKALVGKSPPDFVKGHDLKGLTDQQMLALQDWCSLNSRPKWATGLSIIEAAELIVAGAVENGNISSAKEVAKSSSLTPPDLKRCQAEVPTKDSFMTLGGRPGKRVRCSNKPQVVVQETVPGKDGLKGSMSLCGDCLVVFKQINGVKAYRFEFIKKSREKREASSRGTRIDGTTRIGE
jgi:hypothetical protein